MGLELECEDHMIHSIHWEVVKNQGLGGHLGRHQGACWYQESKPGLPSTYQGLRTFHHANSLTWSYLTNEEMITQRF